MTELKYLKDIAKSLDGIYKELRKMNAQPEISKTGHCKDCKYFEYDSVGKVDGMPLIVAHEVCTKWGEGCKTEEDGFCFMFEKMQESEDKE